MTACGDASKSSLGSYESDNETASDENSKQSFLDFNRDMTIENPVMYDKDGLKITAKSLEFVEKSQSTQNPVREGYFAKWEDSVDHIRLVITIENSMGKDLEGPIALIINGITIPNDCFYAKIPDSLHSPTVSNVKTEANVEYIIPYANLIFLGINEISDIQTLWYYGKSGPMGFSYQGDTGLVQVKTTNYKSPDYSTNRYQKNIADFADAADFNILSYSNNPYTLEKGIKILSTTLTETGEKGVNPISKQEEWITEFWIELENTSEIKYEIFTTGIFIVNNQSEVVDVDHYISSCCDAIIYPGEKTVIKRTVFTKDRMFKGASIDLVGEAVNHYADDPENFFSSTIIVDVPNTTDSEYEFKGKEVYNKSGVKVLAKYYEFPGLYGDVLLFVKSENPTKSPLKATSMLVNGKANQWGYQPNIMEILFVSGNKTYMAGRVSETLREQVLNNIKFSGTVNGDAFTANFSKEDEKYKFNSLHFAFIVQE